jgi:hypothetical protein
MFHDGIPVPKVDINTVTATHVIAEFAGQAERCITLLKYRRVDTVDDRKAVS